MAVPKHKSTKSKKRRRASHFALTDTTTSTCTNCNAVRRPHHACTTCGQYKGRQVISVKSATKTK